MKLIESKAEYIPQEEGLEGIYKQIELCGRTCYKSEDKITEDSARGFVDRMIKSNHTAMLEHGTVYLYLEVNPENAFKKFEYPLSHFTAGYNWSDVVGNICARYRTNHYSKVASSIEQSKTDEGFDRIVRKYYITSNYRVIIENNWLDDFLFLCSPTEHHEKRYTMRFKGDIHLYKDKTRHRVMSYAIESTRFCNYMKEKFGMSVSFMYPTWLKEEFLEEFKTDCKTLENIYFKWIEKGLKAEEAAYFLCQGTAAEYCITGFSSDWKNLLDLRLFEKTGKVHPDMLSLMQKTQKTMQEAGIWEDIMKYPSKFE